MFLQTKNKTVHLNGVKYTKIIEVITITKR